MTVETTLNAFGSNPNYGIRRTDAGVYGQSVALMHVPAVEYFGAYVQLTGTTQNTAPTQMYSRALLMNRDAAYDCISIVTPAAAQPVTDATITDVDWTAGEIKIQTNITTADNINFVVGTTGFYLLQSTVSTASVVAGTSYVEAWFETSSSSLHFGVDRSDTRGSPNCAAVVYLTAGDSFKVVVVSTKGTDVTVNDESSISATLLDKGMTIPASLYLTSGTKIQNFATSSTTAIDWSGATTVGPQTGITTSDNKTYKATIKGLYLIGAQFTVDSQPDDILLSSFDMYVLLGKTSLKTNFISFLGMCNLLAR
jgi:hypothetical protein